MIQIKLNDDKVESIYYGETLIEGFIRIESIPSPEEIPGKIPVMYCRNGGRHGNTSRTNGLRRNGKRIDPSEIYLVGGVGDTSAKGHESRGVRGL